MKLHKGSKVLYLPTSEQAIVTKVVNEELVYIRLVSDREEIPAFIDDIGLVEAGFKKVETSIENDQVQVGNDTPKLEKRLYLAVSYKNNEEARDVSWPVYLYNLTNRTINYDINTYHSDSDTIQIKNTISPGQATIVHYINKDIVELNPVFEIDWCFQDASDQWYMGDITMRPSTFFKKYYRLDFLNGHGALYPIQSKQKTSLDKGGTLSDYTKSEQKYKSLLPKSHKSNTIERIASFNPVIDLHIDKLMPQQQSLKKGDILSIQLKAFDQFIDQAIRLKINQVFVIHGVGQGKLKDAIATRLIQNPAVNTFINEFHPKYGYGATEIHLY